MKSSWDLEKGHLTCRWFEVWNRIQYDSAWMRESMDVRGSYLPPLPDFASHSPFGAPSGFQSYFTRQNS